MAAVYLREADVTSLLDMPTAIEVVAAAHVAHARGEAIDYPRQRVRMGTAVHHLLHGALLFGERVSGYKTYISNRQGASFWLHLFAADSGEPLAVIEANALGAMRTGAAGAVAARALARPEASRVVLFGCGWQARHQLQALRCVRAVETVTVFGRDAERVARFCAEMDAGGCVRPGADIEAALAAADIVCTATTSSQPLFDGAWLAAGTHINAAGSNALIRRELDERSIGRAASVVVDSRATALRECGDLLPALEKGRLSEGRLRELGEVLCAMRAGREAAADITLFESQGMAIQDLAVGLAVLQRARLAQVGTLLPF